MPFHNIFKKSKIEEKPHIRSKIIADIHEKDSMILAELSENKEIELIIRPLKIGDYLIGNTIIERKTIQDFVSSMISRRIIEQLKQMRQYKNQLLILEGDLNDVDFNQNAIRGFILSIITNYQIPIIFTQDYEDTSKYLITFAKQQLKKPAEISLHSRIQKTISEQKQYILEAFPGIGPATAKKLLKEFKTLSNTINAKEEDLEKILKNRTKDFKRILEN
ncbi:MAG: ERCC4 domain-containing protein [Candidatus Nanoarchaeia archaeon]|nr:ERCC4 domain-containing protein [Candidatus Nanoarchaeia archaeon]